MFVLLFVSTLNICYNDKKRSNECPILKIHKTYYINSLNKTFGTRFEKYMAFRTLKKSKQCIISRDKFIYGRLPMGVKSYYFTKVKSHNPKTWEYICKIFDIQLETSLLINFGRFSSFSTKKLDISSPISCCSAIVQNFYP